MDLLTVLLPIFVLFCLWLGYRILQKAGFAGVWTWVLLVPIVNIIMIWVFAFSHWPKQRGNSELD
ncbi:hypothetical protein KEF85_13005 [Methylomonas paludis]|uniref:Uncharacterized protein n=1 Tax=Methylomonas paludis TaxID=1173101 RepID=A0A975MLY5_9GAMM|nr:hypothetical protein [Methylomonas paludis]QWF70252.1 hypothetical protein KEF85_13005 [Methylomonas paludis]